MSTVPNAALPHERHAADTIDLHRPTARTVPLWQVIIQPAANGPLILNVVARDMQGAIQTANAWLVKTNHSVPRYESVNLIGEVVAHGADGVSLLDPEEN
jgi:hypothetical protein